VLDSRPDVTEYAARFNKLIDTLKRHPDSFPAVAYNLVKKAIDQPTMFDISSKSKLLYIAGKNAPNNQNMQRNVNRLIIDIMGEFDKIDESTVISLNRAFAKFPMEHGESSRAFKTMNDSVSGEIMEKTQLVDVSFLVKYLASFNRSSKI